MYPSCLLSDLCVLFMFFKKLLYYLNPKNLFKKEEVDVNLKMMHIINKVSIFLFIACLIYMAIQILT